MNSTSFASEGFNGKTERLSSSWYKWRSDRGNQGSSLRSGPQVYLSTIQMSIILYERQILKPPHLTLLQALQHPFLLHLKFTFLKTNFQSGNVLWQSKPLSKVIAYSSSALSYDQTTLYVGSYDNSLYAISARNGSISWRFPTGYLMFCFLNTLKL